MSNAQECLERIVDELLGDEFKLPEGHIGQNQANRLMAAEVIRRYKPRPKKPKKGIGLFFSKFGKK